jgi:hypothetical protein
MNAAPLAPGVSRRAVPLLACLLLARSANLAGRGAAGAAWAALGVAVSLRWPGWTRMRAAMEATRGRR